MAAKRETITSAKLSNLRDNSNVNVTLPRTSGEYVQFQKGKSIWYRNVETGEEITRRVLENYKREGVSREKIEKRKFLELGNVYDIENFYKSNSRHFSYEYRDSLSGNDIAYGAKRIHEFMRLIMRNFNENSKTKKYSYAVVFELEDDDNDSGGDEIIRQTRTLDPKSSSNFLKIAIDKLAQKIGGSYFNWNAVSNIWVKIIEKTIGKKFRK